MNQHETEQRREMLIKKICMAQSIAAKSEENQSIVPNAIGGLDIVPSNRDQSEQPIVIIGVSHSNRISNGQAGLLIRMTDSGYSKEDVVHAAYAMGYLAAEAKLKRAIDRLEKLAKELMIDVTVLEDGGDE